MKIVPAIIPKSFADLEEKAGLVSGGTDLVQIDICDGDFAPTKSWPYQGDTGQFADIVRGGKILPRADKLDFEIHLMVRNPETVIADWIKTGVSRILIHAESASADIIGGLLNKQNGATEIGLAVNLETPLSEQKFFFGKTPVIQLMGIRRIGFQGGELDTAIFGRIKELREAGYEGAIAVDGGVNLENARELAVAGADRLVVGSAILNSGDIIGTIGKFKKLFENGEIKQK